MERVLKIPEFLSHLKTYGGYPVSFTQLWASGVPDFRAVDLEHCARCLRDKLCEVHFSLILFRYRQLLGDGPL